MITVVLDLYSNPFGFVPQ